MNTTIRPMNESDRESVLEMMRIFYASPAVLSNGSEEIFQSDVENCVNNCPFLEGYVFEADDKILGYAMLAKSFSTEFGKPCIWIEDLYIKEDYRGLGIGSQFFACIEEKYKNVIFRLEAEEENGRAVRVYKKCGYEVLPYLEMKKINE
ncbi:MAG: GNAT family N-acetyltransferase [Lachnospiraceae bacterium]|nr:GNAT family N-acetyltransferase [Lachnospiraceae bacterium]